MKIAADSLPTYVGSGLRFRPFKEAVRSSAAKQSRERFEVFRTIVTSFVGRCCCLHIAFPILAHQPIALNPYGRVMAVRDVAAPICVLVTIDDKNEQQSECRSDSNRP
ncbi:MAG: hypothetical protein ABR976_01820 [Terracidiphilus sp.]